MQETIIEKIVDLENLYWAWRKLKVAYNKATDIWLNTIEISSFEADLDNNILIIKEQVLKGTYELSPIFPVPYPKTKDKDGNPQTRPAFYIQTRDQLLWIAVLGVIGPEYDYQMPFWSYGHRLFITSWIEKDAKISGVVRQKHGWYRNSTNKIYRNWQQSWPRFRKHLQLTIEAMSGQLDNEIKSKNISPEDKAEIESNEGEKKFLQNQYILKSYWKSKSSDLYWGSLDFAKFYPSIETTQLLLNLIKFNSNITAGSNEAKLLERLLDFKISTSSNWLNEELKTVGLLDQKIGLPTGLIVSGFLSNIAMLDIDKKMSSKLEERKIACFRFVDDHIILSKSKEDLIEWTDTYLQVLKDSRIGVQIKNDKTEPEELKNYLNGGTKEEVIRTLKRINPDNPTPLVTRTLMKLSLIADHNINFLTTEESNRLLKDLDHILLADFADHEIKKETQVSFAITVLSRLIPKLKRNYDGVYELQKTVYKYNQKIKTLEDKRKNLSEDDIKEKEALSKEIDTFEKIVSDKTNEINEIVKNADNKHKQTVELYFRLFIQIVSENFSKPKLWQRIIEFTINTGKNSFNEIFSLIDKLNENKEINLLSVQALNNLCVTIYVQQIFRFLKISKKELTEHQKVTINEFFDPQLINDILKNRLNSNKYDSVNTRKIYILLLRYYIQNYPDQTEVIIKSINVDDMSVFLVNSEDANDLLSWLLMRTIQNETITDEWKDISLASQKNVTLNEFLRSLTASLDIEKTSTTNYRTINCHLERDALNNNETRTAKTLLDYIADFKSINAFENLLYDEYAILKIFQKLIILYKKEFHGIVSPDFQELIIHPDCFILTGYPSDKKFESWSELNNYLEKKIVVSYDKRSYITDNRYTPENFKDYNNKELIEVYSLGIILWQMCFKTPILPFSLLLDNSKNIYTYINSNNLVPSIFCESIIKSCISPINRESEFWINNRITIPDFTPTLEEENSKKGYPPVITNLNELERRVNKAIKLIKSGQLSLKNNHGRQLVYYSIQKPTIQFDILKHD
jgi:hypothetical protein